MSFEKEMRSPVWGGDEFVIALELYTHQDLNKVIERIDFAVHQYNDTSGKEYCLSLSLGADLFFENADDSVEAIINKVDHMMYVNKRSKKQVKTTERTNSDDGSDDVAFNGDQI